METSSCTPHKGRSLSSDSASLLLIEESEASHLCRERNWVQSLFRRSAILIRMQEQNWGDFSNLTWLLCYRQISLHHCLCIQGADRLIQLTNLQRRLEPKIKGEALIALLDKLEFSFGFCISCFGSGGAKVLLRWKKENEAEWEASCVMCIVEVEGRKCGVLCGILALDLGHS